jgi:ankyrin repeat protein
MSLIEASRNGNIERVQALIDADPNIQNMYGYTALICASCHGHIKIVQALLKAGANPMLKNNLCYSVLTYAIQNRCIKSIKLLSSVIILVPCLHKLSKNKLPYNILRESQEYL